MKTITLPRTGFRPARFQGEVIAETSSRGTGQTESRWYELGLYQKQDGSYVLHIGYRTSWDGEQDNDLVFVESTPDGVEDQLLQTTPRADVVGYPPGKQFAEKQERLMRTLEDAYRNACSRLLESLPEEI